MNWVRFARLGAWLLLAGCSNACGVAGAEFGSETNWIRACKTSGDCDGVGCNCGVCTRVCQADAECDGLAGATCSAKDGEGFIQQCASSTPPSTGICLPRCSGDNDCAKGLTCVGGSCVLESNSVLDGGTGSTGSTGSGGGAGAGNSGGSLGEDQIKIVEVGSLTSESPPAECVAGLPELLPGCDTADMNTWGLDCDGDSVPDYRTEACVVATAERPAYFGGEYDCDPHDATLRYWVTPDADADGYGPGISMCAGPVVPDGYVRLLLDNLGLSDCNDGDASVHPGATDTWGDGADTDCSGDDYPNCSVIEGGLEFPRQVTRDPACTGADLFISGPKVCGEYCLTQGGVWGFVANRGNAASTEPIVLSWQDDKGGQGSIELSSAGLAPGESTAIFEVTFELVTEMALTIESEDCNSENNSFVMSNPDGDEVCLF